MRYSIEVGGKRVRPVICLATAEAAGGDAETALPAAAALELVHTFSLVHDDLPALDDDEERRGHPSTWKRYGEAVGILAGDALLAEAFRLALSYPTTAVGRELAQSTLGMIGGQYLDITGTASDLASLHRLKTGCLFAASVGLGLWAAEVPEREQRPWRAFGDELGLLFQVVDDILDEDGYVLEHGTDGARQLADESAERARAALANDRCRHDRARRHRRRARGPNLLKKRLDVLLVERGLAESRAQAQALVLAGQVPGYEKAGQQVDESAELTVTQPARVRLARRREARPRARGVRARGRGPRRARRRRLDGRVHRRAAPARRRARDRARRRLRAAPSAHPRRPARDACWSGRTCARSPSSRSRRSSSSATSRSSACARPCRRRWRSPRPAGRRSCS